MLPSMVFCTVTKLTETNQNITVGSKKVDWCVRFVSGSNRCIVSVPTRIGSLNATEHGFLHSNETDRNKPKHHYWVQKSRLGAFVSVLARISALNATEHGFLHSNETDRNKPKHHYWVQKSRLAAFVSFLARIGASFRFRPESGH